MAPDSCDLYVKKSTPQPSPTPAPTPPPIAFWPLPTSLSMGATPLMVSPTLAFNIAGGNNADLAAYAARTAALMFQHASTAPSGAALSAVSITVANPTAPLVLGVDESYTLTIPADGSSATITAATNYGAYWALQTLAQAVQFNFDTEVYTVAAAPISITDKPKFAWRGILIDTDRHWQSLPVIFSIIDGLTYSKMNILHWHIVDWQAWPLQSVAYPKLWAAAWSSRERYTLKDIDTVVEYARARGVRVVPEFDTPGHASSMCVSYPELCPSAACGPSGNSPLSPVPDASGNNVALNAIQAVLGEIAARSPDEFFHLGGDEVDQACWANTPAVQTWMKQNGINTTDGVYEYFVDKVDKMTLALNKSPIRWEVRLTAPTRGRETFLHPIHTFSAAGGVEALWHGPGSAHSGPRVAVLRGAHRRHQQGLPRHLERGRPVLLGRAERAVDNVL
jgi:hexosaminidase